MKTTIREIPPTPSGGRLIAVSDIHGYVHYLHGLLDKLRFSDRDTLVIIGDLIEKGPESLATVRFVLDLIAQGFHISVSMGNVEMSRLSDLTGSGPDADRRFFQTLRYDHDVWKRGLFLDMMDDLGISLENVISDDTSDGVSPGNASGNRISPNSVSPGNAFDDKITPGGTSSDNASSKDASDNGISPNSVSSEHAPRITIPALKQTLLRRYRREIDWLLTLPTVLTAGNFIFAHAGVPTDDLSLLRETDAWDCLKRTAFLHENVRFTRYIVTGHWPVTLYRSDIDNMSPIYDAEKRIIAIDGGCALKAGAQLNALILPAEAQDMSQARFEHYDDFPVIRADHSQKKRKATVHMRYFDCSVDVLEEIDDLVRLRHQSTGQIFLAPKYLLYHRPGKPVQCDDYSDALLEVHTGDRLSVVQETSIGRIVKKDGELGWYLDEGSHPCSLFCSS